MLTKIDSQTLSSLSASELDVLKYINSNKARILKMSIQEIAKECFTSTATIMRLCKKIGFSGFSELKYSISKSVKAGPLGLWHVKNIFISFISQGSAASLFIILISNPTETPHTNYHIHTIKGTILMLTKQQSHQHNLKTLQETAITLYLINRSLYTQQQQLCICDVFLLKVCKHLKMLTYRL